MRRRSRAAAEAPATELDDSADWGYDESADEGADEIAPVELTRYDTIPEFRPPRLLSIPVLAATIVVAIGAGIAAGVLLGHRATTYTATAVLSIDQPRAVAQSDNSGVLQKLAGLRAEYAAFAGTDKVAVPVGNQLGVQPGLVRRAVHATPAGAGLLLTVRATTRDPALAVQLATAVSANLVTLAQNYQADAKVSVEQRYELQIVTPSDNAVSVKSDEQRRIVLGAVVFAVILLAGGGLSVAVARRV